MRDDDVAASLRSDHPLVVVEAPAGCGKTYQGSVYARELAESGRFRVLVLTHTHAAVDEFVSRASGKAARVDVRTIDSLVTEIAGAYHKSLRLPAEVGRWATREPDGFRKQADLVARLLRATRGPASAIARRYPVVIFDEHQDASESQADLVDALVRAGARVRVLGDPMQIVYPEVDAVADRRRWNSLRARADLSVDLRSPHRWADCNPELGEWILAARETLACGGCIDLRRSLPVGLTVVRADDTSTNYRRYGTTKEEGRRIRTLAESEDILILTSMNDTVMALRAYFGRRVPVWEGHTRPALERLVAGLSECQGDPAKVADVLVAFVQKVAVGFSSSRFGSRLVAEVREGCSKKTRGMPARLQEVGRCLLEAPDHRGVAHALRMLWHLRSLDGDFGEVKIDHPSEFWDGIRLGSFEDPEEGLAEIAQRRTWLRPTIPTRALSTVHKAKGLERGSVVVIPCDRKHFGDRLKDRCTMYVAMSRATNELTLVVPRTDPTPLFRVA